MSDSENLHAGLWGHYYISRHVGLLAHSPRQSIDEINDFWDRVDSESGKGIEIFLVDSGINKSHPEFSDQSTMLFYDAFNSNGIDLVGHGTAMASLLIGKKLGLAKKAKLINVKVFDRSKDGDERTLISALDKIIEYYFQ